MTENSKSKPGFRKSPPDEIPAYREALTQYQEKAKQSNIETIKGGNNLEWDNWKATIEYGHRICFEHIWDFFVNLPSLHHVFSDESLTDEWYWNKLESVPLSSKFYYRPEILRLLRANAGTDSLIEEGWLLKHVAGRIDTETTWTDTSYLIATNSFYAYIQLYTEQIH